MAYDSLQDSRYPASKRDYTWTDEISPSTIIRLLVEKGILTPHEIIEEERRARSLGRKKDARQPNGKMAWLSIPVRRLASKHRWSRRLTSFLFGWQWKKAKHPLHKEYDS